MSPIKIDPEIMHGTPCFKGTRVPVGHLFDILEHGGTVGEFLEGFPSVSREMTLAVLEQAKTQLFAHLVQMDAA